MASSATTPTVPTVQPPAASTGGPVGLHVLLSVGNAPGFKTGYGGQAALLLNALLTADARTTVTVLAWNFSRPNQFAPVSTATLEAAEPELGAVVAALPAPVAAAWRRRVTWLGNWYGRPPARIFKAHLNAAVVRTRADLFLCLQDIFMFEAGAFACPSVVWVPLHFWPVEKQTVRALSDFDVVTGISAWGAGALQELFGAHHGLAALKHVACIPHGRPIDVFCPGPHALDASDAGVAQHRAWKTALRRRLGWPTHVHACGTDTGTGTDPTGVPAEWEDAPGGAGAVHITLLIASNSEVSGRKAFDAQLQAWVAFTRRREAAGFPRAASFLVIHADLARAYDLGRILELVGEFPERPLYEALATRKGVTVADAVAGVRGERFLISPAARVCATSDADMAAMMGATDALLAATASEGCGVPILEAQQCACPVVTNATTAMPEQTVLGVAAAPGQWIMRMDFNSGWYLPSVDAVADALLEVSRWGDPERAVRAAAALPVVRARYGEAPVAAAWQQLVRRLQRDVVRPWRAAVTAAGTVNAHTVGAADTSDHVASLPSPQWVSGSGPLGAWRAATGTDAAERVWVSPQRAMLVVAARVAEEQRTVAVRANATLNALRTEREALHARLTYVTAALAALAEARAAVMTAATAAHDGAAAVMTAATETTAAASTAITAP